MGNFKKVYFSKETMNVLEYLGTKITEDYSRSSIFECEVAFEYYSVSGGDIWIYSDMVGGRNDFSSLNPEWHIGLSPEDLREELSESIEYGQTIFASSDFHEIIEEICEELLEHYQENDESFIEQYYPELLEE